MARISTAVGSQVATVARVVGAELRRAITVPIIARVRLRIGIYVGVRDRLWRRVIAIGAGDGCAKSQADNSRRDYRAAIAAVVTRAIVVVRAVRGSTGYGTLTMSATARPPLGIVLSGRPSPRHEAASQHSGQGRNEH